MEARSTVVARFPAPGIAGPEIEQHLSLFLYFFPGDGEAIRRSEVSFDQELVQVRGARSVWGEAQVGEGVVGVAYEARPLGKECIDTLALDLVGRRAEVETRWLVRIYSSADSSGTPAHTTGLALEVQQPVVTEVRMSPARAFAGEQTQTELVLRNADTRGRRIEAAQWEFPPGVALEEGSGVKQWPAGLLPGQQDTLRWRVRLGKQAGGQVLLRGRADADGVVGSPLPDAVVQVAAAPQLRVSGPGEWLEVGQRCPLQCEWTNPGPDSLAVSELEVEIPAAFAEVALAASAGQAQLVAPQAGQKGSLRVPGPRSLGPGQGVRVELSAKAQRPGLYAWKGSFRPVGGGDPIPLDGEALVRVAQAADARPGKGQVEALPTDLELVGRALAEGVESQLQDLPLLPGAALALGADEKGSDSWLVEDVLAAALLRRGYHVVLAPAGSAGRLRYRLAEAKVVCARLGAGWNPFRARTGREAYGELFLRLEEPGRQVRWARRVQAYRADQVPASAAAWLGGSEVVKRIVVAPDHRMVSRVLSGSILGGLTYIFFVP